MSPRDQDDDLLPESPTIVPDRDDVENYQRQKGGKPPKPAVDPLFAADEQSYEEPAAAPHGRGPLLILAGIALVALGWAGFLQFQLANAETALDSWQLRVADLEKRLSVTDESSNQSAAALQVKLQELDEALAKVRDDNLKKAKSTLDQHASQLAALDQSLKATAGTAGKAEQIAEEQKRGLESARAQLEKLAPAVDQNKRKLDEQQAAIASLTEKGNVTSANVEKLGLRMNTNEEWVQSINNFRKQTNREIVNIKQQIGGPISEAAPK